MSIDFESPANRIISQFAPKNKFRINTSLSGEALFRQLSIQGRLRYFQQDLGTDLDITPPTGETFFLYKVIASGTTAQTRVLTITNSGRIRAAIQITTETSLIIDFMDSLVGNGSDTLTFSQSSTSISVSVFGWVENTSRIRDVTT